MKSIYGLATRLMLGCALVLIPTLVFATENRSLISPDAARRAGMRVQWFGHVQVDSSRGEIAYTKYHVNAKRTTTVFDVTYGSRTEVFSEKDVDVFGEPLGIEKAQKKAEARAEVLRLSGNEVTVTQEVLPEITIYFMTDQSVLHAIDGESGKTRWIRPIGRSNHLAMPFDADDDFVVCVNGMSIFVVDAITGRINFSRRLLHAAGTGPVLSKRYLFLPLINGKVQAFPLWDKTAPVELLQGVGRNFVAPVVTDRTVSWPNNLGHLSVAFTNQLTSIRFRLEAGREILAPPTPLLGDYLVTTSSDGYVHCINEVNGRIEWVASTGESLHKSPFVLGDQIFVTSTIGNLYRFSHGNGDTELIVPGIEDIIAASDDRLFCVGTNQQLLVLDRETGAIMSRVNAPQMDFWMVNTDSDRAYVGSRRGAVQCLRLMDLERPHFHVAPDIVVADDDAATEPPEDRFEGIDRGDDSGADDSRDDGPRRNPFGRR